MKDLKSKIVVITGASAGLGRAAAMHLPERGQKLLLWREIPKALQGTKKEVENAGGKCYYYKVDVGRCRTGRKNSAKIENNIGPVDVWVNNAMASVFSPLKEMTADEFKRVTEVTYLGQVYCTMSA